MLLAVAGLQSNEVTELARKLADGDWSEFSAAEQIAFTFAHKLSKDPAKVTDDDIAALVRTFGAPRALDIIWYVSWCNYMTRVADAFQLPLEHDNVFATPQAEETPAESD